ncbi:glycoside hydrolase family 2 TIM barrel-domain containing protein [Sphingobacterium spiritivorum]|uniref:glycoside hydrolase family 2 TIM barrel-domain containing protein n=1 Tax=Sphingobacterium spiritivorum TaxID=258 RepID=UPI003DA3C266
MKVNTIAVWVMICAFVSVTKAQQLNTRTSLPPIPAAVTGTDQPSLSLNGMWNFRSDQSSTSAINVPGEWEMQGYHISPGEKAIYEKEFTLPASWVDKRVVVRFDAVSSHAIVKVNGIMIGEHEGGFVAFHMDLTSAIRPGKNILTVEVQANTISDILGCVSQYAAHTVGGILRKVTLFALPQVYISDLDVNSSFDSLYRHAKLDLNTRIMNHTRSIQDAGIRYTLKDKEGKVVFVKNISEKALKALTSEQLAVRVAVDKPHHWTAETPYLYELTTELLNDRHTIQRNVQKVGFREVKIAGNQLLINGKPVKLKGVNRHSVHPLLGRASDPELDRKDAELFLAANLNYIRTSHYPPSEEFLHAADELGLYVESESALNWIQHHASPIWQHWDYQDPKFLPLMIQANRENVMTNKKHPSVILWSLGNESRWSNLWAEVNKTVKLLDKSRPTSFHDQTWGGFNNAGSKADVANYHYPGIDGPANTDTISRPTLFGEYAHLSTYNRRELLTDPGIRDLFNAPMRSFFDSIYVHKGNLGGAIWSGIDDTFHLPDGRIAGYGPWGPLDGWRRTKPEYYGIKKAYSPVRVLNMQRTKDGVMCTVQNRYDFCSLEDIKILAVIDGKEIRLKSSIKPHDTGQILIPQAKDADTVEIMFTDSRGFEIEHEIFTDKKPVQVAHVYKSLSLKEDSAFIYITQGNIDYTISKTYGVITTVRKNKELILTKGPSLAIIAANTEDGGKPNVAGETYQNNIYPLKHYPLYTLFAKKVSVENKTDSILVNLNLSYQQGEGNQQFVFTKDGFLKVRYEMENKKSDIQVYQYGLMMELPLTFDELTWHREGPFSYYPKDHIGRNKGFAKLNANNIYDVEAHGKPLARDWKDDANTLGSNDFRSTKANIISAELKHNTQSTVKVMSNAKQASRSWKQDEHIQWLIADYTNNGSEPFYGSPHSSGRLTLRKGDKIKGMLLLKID